MQSGMRIEWGAVLCAYKREYDIDTGMRMQARLRGEQSKQPLRKISVPRFLLPVHVY